MGGKRAESGSDDRRGIFIGGERGKDCAWRANLAATRFLSRVWRRLSHGSQIRHGHGKVRGGPEKNAFEVERRSPGVTAAGSCGAAAVSPGVTSAAGAAAPLRGPIR